MHCLTYQVIGETAQCFYIGYKHTCELVSGPQYRWIAEAVKKRRKRVPKEDGTSGRRYAYTDKTLALRSYKERSAERWSVPIVWLEFRDNEAGFEVVDFASASREGEPFEALIRKSMYLPNPVTRSCTINPKIRIIHKYLRTLDHSTEDNSVDMMTGIRADEPRRVAKMRNRKSTSESKWATMVMPLADASVGVKDVTDFWAG
ncbi:hypothetical protein GBC55_006915 [Pseudomonas sp. TNT3]|nr:hypothetical protein [Pseudomonas sp. TNT3]KAI2693251.1 hypothetical protein GBC55_006915 [Pseudomonas sp. TNT3]